MSEVKTFALDTVERAAKTVAQGAAAGAAVVLVSVDGQHVVSAAWWQQVLVAAAVGGTAGLASVLTSIGSAVKTGTASLSRKVASTAVPQPQLVPPAVVETPPAPVAAVPASDGAEFGEPVYAETPTPPTAA